MLGWEVAINSDYDTSPYYILISLQIAIIAQLIISAPPSTADGNDGLSSLYVGPLHAILKGLVDNLLRSPSSNQKARAYLSGALLYYLVLTKRQKERQGKSECGFHLVQVI